MKTKLIKLLRTYSFFLILVTLFSCGTEDTTTIEESNPFNAAEFVDFEAGNIPLILSVPHGGELKPNEIPNRTCNNAVTVMDDLTIELSQAIMTEFAKTGKKPYLIVNKMHRSKMDANRNREDATCDNINAEDVWDLYHNQIKNSRSDINKKFQKGLFIDLHGHGNPKQRIELGYLLYEDELALSDEILNSPELLAVSSIQNLAKNNLSGKSHTNLLKGENAFGTLLNLGGFAAVPSLPDPVPLASDNYFSGGYNTANYGSYKSGTIDGIQVECNRSGIRETAANRQAFATAFVRVVTTYLETHYFSQIPVQD